ncbi:MAG: DUF5684 domain-containing protein [bacterium]
MIGLIVYVALTVFLVVTMWKVFAKAGQPGWACLVPIYNTCVWLKIAGKPMWWFFLLLIPVVNFIIAILAVVGLANKFGKGGGFAVGLIFLPIIFYPILAFGDAEYQQ